MTALTFRILHADCGAAPSFFDLFVNDVPVGSFATTQPCECTSDPLVVTFTDAPTLELIDRGGCNTFRVDISGGSDGDCGSRGYHHGDCGSRGDHHGDGVVLGYAQVLVGTVNGTLTSCLFDGTAGNAAPTCADRATCDPPGFSENIPSVSGLLNCAVCGDGALDAGEQCDDGNTVGGDGCSPTCELEYAVFAGAGADCAPQNPPAIEWLASIARVRGNVHSNGAFKLSAYINQFRGLTTYHCSATISGWGNWFASGPTKVGVRPLPLSFTAADFAPCTFEVAGNFDLSANGPWWEGGTRFSRQLKPGVYCANSGKITLSQWNVSGNVTFVASGSIEILGGSFDLTPFKNNVQMFSTADIKVSGYGGSWAGYLYAPTGQVLLSGANSVAVNGGVVASTVKVTANNVSITAPSAP